MVFSLCTECWTDDDGMAQLGEIRANRLCGDLTDECKEDGFQFQCEMVLPHTSSYWSVVLLSINKTFNLFI